MRIAITGANGFIGSVLAVELFNSLVKTLPNPPQLILVDSVPFAIRPGLVPKDFSAQRLNEVEFLSMLQSGQASKLDVIFHMGAISSTTETNWGLLQANNVEYTQKLFAYCTQNQVPFIYASSAATYGDGSLGYLESLPCNKLVPLNLYGKSKLITDEWILAQKETPPNWYGVRFFNVYGPNEIYKNAMASLVWKSFHSIKNVGKIQLFQSHRGDYKHGEQKRDFVYVKDVVLWMIELWQKKPASGIYNLGSGSARTWLDLSNAVFAAMEIKPNIEFIPMPENLRAQYQYFTEAPMEKAFTAGLSKPSFTLERGVQDYVANHLIPKNGCI